MGLPGFCVRVGHDLAFRKLFIRHVWITTTGRDLRRPVKFLGERSM